MFLQTYDKCFSDFFEKFISAETSAVSNPCDRLHEAYRHCIEKVISFLFLMEKVFYLYQNSSLCIGIELMITITES